MNKRLSKVAICLFMCLLLFIPFSAPVLATTGTVADVPIWILVGILYAMGVDTVNGQPISDMAYYDQLLFGQSVWGSLNYSSQQEIIGCSSGLGVGYNGKGAFEVALSNATLQDIYSLFRANLTSLDEGAPNDSRNFSYTSNKMSLSGTANVSYVYFEDFFIKTSGIFNSAVTGDVTLTTYYDAGYTCVGGYLIAQNFANPFMFDKNDWIVTNKVIGQFKSDISEETVDIKLTTKYSSSSMGSLSVSVTCAGTTLSTSITRYHLNQVHGFGANKCSGRHNSDFALILLEDAEGKKYMCLNYADWNPTGGSTAGNCQKSLHGRKPVALDNGSAFLLPTTKKLVIDLGVIDGFDDIGNQLGALSAAGIGALGVKVTVDDDGLVTEGGRDGVIDWTGTTTAPVAPTVPKLDIPDLEVPHVAFTKFPFCIPYDIIKVFKMLNAQPVAPVFKVPLVSETVTVDLSIFSSGVVVVKYVLYLFFVFGLVKITRKLIGNGG